MKHLGDITKLNGAEIPVVDVICGGSPCQDLSIAAGKRAGLDGERSGLFMEQIRVIKEMREHDRRSGRTGYMVRPRWVIWENVPGAFTSNGGGDFQTVLTEFARIAEPNAPVVPMPAEGWPNAGCLYDDVAGGWSIAWRVHDSQFWGVPQRRVRVSVVTDFGGLAAPEVCFERKGLRGFFETRRKVWEPAPADAERSTGEPSSYTIKIRGGREVDSSGKRAGKGALVQTELSGTISVTQDQTLVQVREPKTVCFRKSAKPHSIDEAPTIVETDISPALTSFDVGESRSNVLCKTDSIVRRLTPLECERLQGFPDNWTNIGAWTDSKGKKRQTSDGARYRALGNSIALPYWQWLARRVCAQYERGITVGSLFDGIGGFPLVFSRCGAAPLWASEIEEFPIAVTKYHFPEVGDNG